VSTRAQAAGGLAIEISFPSAAGEAKPAATLATRNTPELGPGPLRVLSE
jgi:hypothetical protein